MEIREYYELILDLSVHKGWKVFIEDMERDLQNVSSIQGVDSVETLFFKKGQMQVLTGILSFEENARKGLEELDEDNS